MSVRIMMRGEDGMIWCEKNNVTEEWAEENGDSLCFEYENAQWWVEKEENFDFFIEEDFDFSDEEIY